MRITSIALLAASAALLAACSSAPVPREQMAVAKSAVERVNTNPGIVSSAPVELARAERAMSNRDYVQARRLAEQASVDARLAESKTAALRGESAVREVQESIRSLDDELQRRGQ